MSYEASGQENNVLMRYHSMDAPVGLTKAKRFSYNITVDVGVRWRLLYTLNQRTRSEPFMKRTLILLFTCAFVCGCSDSGLTEAGKSGIPANDQVSQSINDDGGFDFEALKHFLDGNFTIRVVNGASQVYKGGESVDYDRLKSDMRVAVEDGIELPVPPKYQFIAAPNENWVYRCNLQTGKIEVYSMASNKLLLLSETRSPKD